MYNLPYRESNYWKVIWNSSLCSRGEGREVARPLPLCTSVLPPVTHPPPLNLPPTPVPVPICQCSPIISNGAVLTWSKLRWLGPGSNSGPSHLSLVVAAAAPLGWAGLGPELLPGLTQFSPHIPHLPPCTRWSPISPPTPSAQSSLLWTTLGRHCM